MTKLTLPAYSQAAVRLQLLLATRGFSPGAVDGIAGPKTQRAVLRAAKDARLSDPTPAAVTAWLRERLAQHVLVPRVSTPIAGGELFEALTLGALKVLPLTTGAYPPMLRMARAHLLLEHGPDGKSDHGLRAVHTFNLGNVMTGRAYMGPWFDMTALERDRYGNMVPRKSHWRASSEPEEGARRYWGMLAEKFPRALAWMGSGEPAAFAHVLKAEGYYTAKEGAYAELLAACWKLVG